MERGRFNPARDGAARRPGPRRATASATQYLFVELNVGLESPLGLDNSYIVLRSLSLAPRDPPFSIPIVGI